MSDAAERTVAVVVAAGRSSRLPGPVPKQYRTVAGRSVLEHAVRAMAAHAAVDGVVVVLPADDVDAGPGRSIAAVAGVEAVVAGGESRADSVALGLAAAGDARWVLVHDGARPRPAPAMVDRVVEAMRAVGAAVPALAPTDTVKWLDGSGRIERTLARERLAATQTPQGFRVDWLRDALARRSDGPSPTDEAAALEAAGRPVARVEGDPGNRKITRATDLRALRDELEGGEMRIGTGFDVHRTARGRRMMLGGVEFEGELGLEGHSDADVVLHAAMDALLGAAGLDDIGAHFPPEDARWKDASSVDLSRRVAALVRAAGWEPVNLDLTLLGERPRIRPRVDEMRRSIAAAFGIEPERVGLKATTLERLGALGRGEGVACQSAALVRRAGEDDEA